ncbi:protein of unknown function [Candidatus Hydrogenisulfobacillus filiaventi]|uniref:Uncharacterized protein n=1 Tax=Candidatus Hydrogenisulfobacillus filiaventi TaxID=2707344 RepID=A0A6F8ZDS0_9FIRM|nr:protein of unknown function [Candidatus Hydrogenisulfobacillus filiaventi]
MYRHLAAVAMAAGAGWGRPGCRWPQSGWKTEEAGLKWMRWRWWLVTLWVLVAAVALPEALQVTHGLVGGGFDNPRGRAAWADHQLYRFRAGAAPTLSWLVEGAGAGTVQTAWTRALVQVGGRPLLLPAGLVHIGALPGHPRSVMLDVALPPGPAAARLRQAGGGGGGRPGPAAGGAGGGGYPHRCQQRRAAGGEAHPACLRPDRPAPVAGAVVPGLRLPGGGPPAPAGGGSGGDGGAGGHRRSGSAPPVVGVPDRHCELLCPGGRD